jgi:hypothetical protein
VGAHLGRELKKLGSACSKYRDGASGALTQLRRQFNNEDVETAFKNFRAFAKPEAPRSAGRKDPGAKLALEA